MEKSDGNRNSLSHASGKFMGVGVQPARAEGMLTFDSRSVARFSGTSATMCGNGQSHLSADG